MVKKARARLFGSWEMNWMAYNFAHDVALPGSGSASLGFLMYPQAETADGRLDCLDSGQLKYEITSREDRVYKRVTDDTTRHTTDFATESGPARHVRSFGIGLGLANEVQPCLLDLLPRPGAGRRPSTLILPV